MSFFCSKYLDTTVTEDEYYEETTEYGGTFVDNVRKAVIVGDEHIEEIISSGYVQFIVNNWWKIIQQWGAKINFTFEYFRLHIMY